MQTGTRWEDLSADDVAGWAQRYDKTYAGITTATFNRHSLAPALWGPSGLDTRARLLMFRIAKQVWSFHGKTADDYAGMHLFVNQLGI